MIVGTTSGAIHYLSICVKLDQEEIRVADCRTVQIIDSGHSEQITLVSEQSSIQSAHITAEACHGTSMEKSLQVEAMTIAPVYSRSKILE